jgi:VanZ family protein
MISALAPALLWGAIVFLLGARSNLPAPRTDLPLDKLAHFVMYGILGAFAARGARRVGGWGWLIAAGLLLGAADEWHQRTVPGRTSDVLDWVADAAGFLLAFAVVYARVGTARERGRNES